MNNNIKTIACLVPIHNGLEDTKKFLQSFYNSQSKLTSKEFIIDLWIIDDGSQDGSAEYIQKNYSDLTILSGSGNLWWSGAINLGLKKVLEGKKSYNYILLFNNDNIIAENYFINLVNIIYSKDNFTILASKVINLYPSEHYQYYGVRYNRLTTKYTKNPNPNSKFLCNIAGGMGMLIPIEIFEIIGLFDSKKFPQYHGDADFFLRAEKKGYPILYHPDLVIYNNNYSTGYKSNNSKEEIKNAYSYPKGYMNLLVDIRFYLRHSFFISALIRIILKNLKFLLKKK